jgi:predicted glycogen debranching enzyme
MPRCCLDPPGERMSPSSRDEAEWLEPDGLGGFASGTASGIRTRRYHSLLLAAITPPLGRFAFVNGYEAWVETSEARVFLTSHRYEPDVIHPNGASRIASFSYHPWPEWRYSLPSSATLVHGIVVEKGRAATTLYWRIENGEAHLFVRLLMSGQDYHSLHHENPSFDFTYENDADRFLFRPYSDLPRIVVRANGTYRHQPEWYRRFLYAQEQERGLDCVEDLASPGVLEFDLTKSEASCVLSLEGHDTGDDIGVIRERELRRRNSFSSPLARAADAYIVQRGCGRTIIAGYPWFGDWGRDTFIAMRGLCIASGRLDDARQILLECARVVSEGMLPNRFPDHDAAPEYNSVDASLWFVIAVQEFLQSAGAEVSHGDRGILHGAIQAILEGYAQGTRFRILADDDGLLAAGEPGVQLTWMDAKVGDWVVTPRIGKPVEVQALWINALAIAADLDQRWGPLHEKAVRSFGSRFWEETLGHLHDVVDVDHRPGAVDSSFRPNQIFAVGGLPYPLLEGERARRVVDAVEARLLTPLGLRSLAPDSPAYCPHYAGGVRERDGAYHQGTVWPWLMGAFIEAWVRVRNHASLSRREAEQRFLLPLISRLDEAGLGHLPEIADGDPPHTSRGCPFQAWSVGEALRMTHFLKQK